MGTEANVVSSTSSSNPNLPTLPFQQKGWNAAANMFDAGTQTPDAYKSLTQGLSYLGNNIGIADTWQSGFNNLLNVANGTTKLNPTQQLADMSQGKYLLPDTNPYLKGTYDQAAAEQANANALAFSKNGMYNSADTAIGLNKGLANLGTQLYGGAYQQGLGQMLQANQQVNALNQQNIANQGNALLETNNTYGGPTYQALRELAGIQQKQIDAPKNDLARYLGLVSNQGNFGSTSTNQQPYFTNPLGQGIGALGGLGSAAYLGSQALNGAGGLMNMFNGGIPAFNSNAGQAVGFANGESFPGIGNMIGAASGGGGGIGDILGSIPGDILSLAK